MTAQGAKRFIALAIAPGLLVMGIDGGIAHFAGREMVNPAQLAPAVFGPAAAVALLLLAATVSKTLFCRALRAFGILAVMVGLAGTGFHLIALARLLDGSPRTFEALQAAVAVAPPLFAPSGFAALGVILVLLPSQRLSVRFGASPSLQRVEALRHE
jgi:hypothetical protein